jgi:two-component system, OmpR family, KDP operon response regulator KdpE
MTSQGRILITDDEPDLRRALNGTLHALGFEITEAANGEQAVERMETGRFHAVLLDINMPGIGGIEACRRLRRIAPGLQILMLTVRDSEGDKVRALDAGADDFITKPFSIPELAARLRSAVRRAQAALPDMAASIRIGEMELDPARRIVRKSNRAVHLTPKAFELLHYLMAHAGVPLTHTRLLRAVWGAEYGGEIEYLRTFIHQLRHRLEDDPAAPEYLLTETGLGYRFREP